MATTYVKIDTSDLKGFVGKLDKAAQGEFKNKKENAVSFSNLGISVEQIAQGMNVSVDQVKQWIAEGLEKGRAK